ncbi:MAG: NAD(P)H-dependent oxidoreductase subunit E [Bacteroidia bacterium]|nr:NAD(P)H-dependent oxidoreductase subunit E [Bacteroidia bacterium]
MSLNYGYGTIKFDAEKRKKISFNEDAIRIFQKIVNRYPEGKQQSALLPVLHLAQAEFDGWLSPEVMDYIAELLKITPIEVYEVATFYTMFNLQPTGKCVLEVCRTSSCWMNGAEDIVEYIGKKLNIKVGETTADGMFTLKTAECLGACGYAPMLQCGASYHENLTLEKVDNLIEKYRNENRRRNYTDMDFEVTK